jgi:hypothetical protein
MGGLFCFCMSRFYIGKVGGSSRVLGTVPTRPSRDGRPFLFLYVPILHRESRRFVPSSRDCAHKAFQRWEAFFVSVCPDFISGKSEVRPEFSGLCPQHKSSRIWGWLMFRLWLCAADLCRGPVYDLDHINRSSPEKLGMTHVFCFCM